MALVITLGLFMLTGCYPGDSAKPTGKDWFGNNLPKEDPDCPIINGDMPVEIEPPAPKMPPGWKQAIFELKVYVLGAKAHKYGGVGQMCLPVGLHVYGTVADQPGLKIDEAGTPRPLPWDAVRTTPWSSTIIVQYDATKIGSPVINLDLIANYTPGPGWNDPDLPDVGNIELSCDIMVNGRSIGITNGWGPGAPNKIVLSKIGVKSVRCQLTMSA